MTNYKEFVETFISSEDSDKELVEEVKDMIKGGTDYEAIANHITKSLPLKEEGNESQYTYRIRKLTPRECFRLMDVSEENIDKIQASGISKSQQYKMAGNSIVVSCLYHIFKNLFSEPEYKTTLF